MADQGFSQGEPAQSQGPGILPDVSATRRPECLGFRFVPRCGLPAYCAWEAEVSLPEIEEGVER